jgi:hypothetical protein
VKSGEFTGLFVKEELRTAINQKKRKKGFTFKNFLPLKFMSLKPERFNKQKFGFKNALC